MKTHVDHHQAVQRKTRRPLFQKSMRRPLASITTLALLAVSPAPLYAQIDFSSGSDESFGPINVTEGTVTLNPPADGIFNATTITVAQGATLTFTRNALNTPIFLLATGNIEIAGTIDVSGQNGTSSPPAGGQGAQGGFDGGGPGIGGDPPGDGLGPGGGGAGTTSGSTSVLAGFGGYGTASPHGFTKDGQPYGGPLLVPLVGGSGGGGMPGIGGGAGGGAILLASDTRVNITGTIRAVGGIGDFATGFGHGSGGAVRIVAPVVSGNGLVDVRGGTRFRSAGSGRIRVDLIDRSELLVNLQGVSSVGAFMQVFPPVAPRLDIVNAAGQAIAEGTPQPVQVLLPFGSPTAQEVTIQARDFGSVVPIAVVLTPDSGPRTVVETEIDNSTANPAQIVVPVEIPVNVVTHVNVWTR